MNTPSLHPAVVRSSGGETWTTGCCPRFDPVPWQGRRLSWRDKLFVREHVRSFLHVPLDMDRHMTHALARIEAAGAQAAVPLTICDEVSPWRSELYVDVSGPVPDVEMATLSGSFVTRVFDGPYRHAPRWADEMRRWVAAQGLSLEKLYFAYTTCPACAKAYKHNYVVLFAKVGPPS